MRVGKFFASMAIAVLALAGTSRAATYDFLTVTGNNTPGNGAFSQFNSVNGNGSITVSHSFSNAAGVGQFDNNNTLINSQFPVLFPGTGPVDGHLAMTVYQYQSVVTFHTQNYAINPLSTIFGIWNITDEVTPPVGGNPVYRVELLDSINGVTTPSMLQVYGNDQNSLDAQGRHHLDFNPSTGELFPSFSINGGIGIHTDATFLYKIPATTLEIRVYADLPALNTIGDGVGYYFAETHVPEPGTAAIVLLLGAGAIARRRR